MRFEYYKYIILSRIHPSFGMPLQTSFTHFAYPSPQGPDAFSNSTTTPDRPAAIPDFDLAFAASKDCTFYII